MTILFWYWWALLLPLLPLMLISKHALPALCVCVLMGSVVRIVPTMPVFIQIGLALILFAFAIALMRANGARKTASASHLGLPLQINEQMLQYKVVQIDKKQVPLFNVHDFALGDQVRVVGIKKDKLVLKKIPIETRN